MTLKTFLLLIGLILIDIISIAQNSFFIIGQIKDLETHESIKNAHIINLNNKRGTISNQKGYFMLHVSDKDYFKISYLGYNNKYVQINSSNKDTLTYYIQRKAFELEVVNVYPWTKEEFKYKFVHNDFNTDSIDQLIAKITVPKAELLQVYNNRNMGVIAIPIFANYKTSKEKQIIQLEKLKFWVKKENEYRKLITHITGYKADQLNAFIKYCNFSKRYISYARDYYLALAIKNKYLEFEKAKRNKK